MKYIIRIQLEHKTDVIREIEIASSKSLKDLHDTIVKSLNLNENEIASFYMTNEELELLEEIPLFKINEEENSMYDMSEMKIESVFQTINNQLIYIYDFLKMWRFLISCSTIKQDESKKIKIINSIGKMPKEAPEIIFESENKFDSSEDLGENLHDEFDETKYKQVIFIIGPTAIGKTNISIELAKILKTEIISCDSRQFYKELKIGAAPPSNKELSEVKHHFIHNLSIIDDYNAGRFEIDAINLIKKLHKKNKNIIVVGGSGLYIDAICKGFDTIPEISKQTRSKVNKEYKRKGLTWAQEQVKCIDPNQYSNYDINNPQRLLRVIEVFEETGKKLSSFKSNKKIKTF